MQNKIDSCYPESSEGSAADISSIVDSSVAGLPQNDDPFNCGVASRVDSSGLKPAQNDGRRKERNDGRLERDEEIDISNPSQPPLIPKGRRSQNDVRMIQSGRSLIEMLATLAIMGVLSIGAIAGFNYAMNKHRANELLDEARKRAYTVMTQMQLGLTRSLGEYSRYNTFAGGTFGSEIVTEGLSGQFGLQVTGVKKAVCQNLVDSVSVSTPLRRVSTIAKSATEVENCSDMGDYLLVYNNNLVAEDAKPCKTDSDCGECGTCNSQGGVCHYKDSLCPSRTPYCHVGTCHKCPVGQMLTRYNQCRSCTDTQQWFEMNDVPNAARECALCPNRKLGSGTCYLPCPEGKKFSTSGQCYDSCSKAGYWTVYPGTQSEAGRRAVNDCLSCGGVPNSANSACQFCTSPAQTFRTGYCSYCPNRVEIANGRYPFCALPCTGGKTLYVGNGNYDYGLCADCDSDSDLNITGVPEGYRCTCPGKRYTDGNLCKKCPDDVSALNPEQRAQCTVG